MRARLASVSLALIGAMLMVLAVQIVDQGAIAPTDKLFVLGWLETQVWVNIPLFLAGAIGVVAAIGVTAWSWRRRRR